MHLISVKFGMLIRILIHRTVTNAIIKICYNPKRRTDAILESFSAISLRRIIRLMRYLE